MAAVQQETIIAIIGALTGGFGVKLVDRYFQLREKQDDDTKSFRGELHDRVMEVLAQLKEAEAETEMWRNKYYSLYAEHCELRAKTDLILQQMESMTGYGQQPQADDEPPTHG